LPILSVCPKSQKYLQSNPENPKILQIQIQTRKKPPMSDIDTLIQQTIDNYFGQGRLSASQNALIADIARHNYYIPILEQQLNFEEWEQYINNYYQTQLLPIFEQSPNDVDIQLAVGYFYATAGRLKAIRFNQVEKGLNYYQTGIELLIQCEVSNAKVRNVILKLHANVASTQGMLGNLQEKLKTEQIALYYAQYCLYENEKNKPVWWSILALHSVYGSTLARLQQTSQQTLNIAPLGFWTWYTAGEVEDKAYWSGTFTKNWQIYLERDYSKPIFLNGIQNLLTDIIQTWHKPEKTHRLFESIPTETLLSIAESLYLLEQAKTKQLIDNNYAALSKINDDENVHYFNEQLKKCDNLHEQNKFCTPHWFNFIQIWWQKYQLKTAQTQLDKLDNIAQQSIQPTIKQSQIQLENWLKHLIQQQPSKLNDLPNILLGILFVCQKGDFETTLKQWQQNPIWHHDLQQALETTHWRQWLENSDKPPLYIWTGRILSEHIDTDKRTRLKIDNEKDNHAQPELVAWLQGKIPEDEPQLSQLLDTAWQTAQQNAKSLGYTFAILNNPDFDDDLSQQIEDETAQQQALIATLLGNGQQQLEAKIKYWLEQQTAPAQKLKTSQLLENAHYRFQRLIDIHTIPQEIPFADSTYQWSMILLDETLAKSESADYGAGINYMTEKAKQIWSLLEHSRIALKTSELTLPQDWEQIFGQKLWDSLAVCIRQVLNGYIPQDDEIFPVITTWLDTINQWQHKRDTSYQTCQKRLQPNQAIMQPFIDNSQNKLRVLWLDKQNLKIYDFSNPQHAANWQPLIDDWQAEKWQNVLDSKIFNSLADDMEKWANDIDHLIAIFPTSLAQFAWEAMPQLANKLSREISIDHWLHCPTSQIENNYWALGVIDKSDMEAAHYIPHETNLVAKQWNTQATLVNAEQTLSLFQALQNLQTHRNIFISTHGVFEQDNPLKSGLSLNNHDNEKGKNNVDLPLWLCTTLRLENTELMILSACQTASSKLDPSNLFDPLNIASVFAATGVNTVIATLSEVDNLTALIFINELLTLAAQKPQTPWHQLIAQTRDNFKNKTDADIKALKKEIEQLGELNTGQIDLFPNKLKDYKGKPLIDLTAPENWANFIVIGDVERCSF
jgi:hypothetical protein